jgi:hypothetical protein
MPRYLPLTIAALTIGLVAMPLLSARAAAPPTGSLVKTGANPAVYLYGADGKRHAFPNEKIFRSWFQDFSGVKTLTAAELAALPLGGNVTYRAGSRLVKITTDPRVYAVTPDGLRAIDSEATAKGLYGDDWSALVDDVPDAFFVDYRLAGQLDGTAWPDGTVVQAADGKLYLIDGAYRRELKGDAAAALSRFALADRGKLSSLTVGSALTSADRPFSEPPTVYPDVPTWSATATDTTYSDVSRELTLATFNLATKSAVTVRQLNFRIEAPSGDEHHGDETDDDLTGLIYGNTIRRNLEGLRLIDAAGREVMAPRELAWDIAQDESQTLLLTGHVNVAAGSAQSFRLVATTHDRLPDSQSFRVTLLQSGTSLTTDAGGTLAFLPATDLRAPDAVARSTKVTVSVAAENKETVRGATGVQFGKFSVQAGATDAHLRRLSFQGYIDNDLRNGYMPGSDADAGVEVKVYDMVSNLMLYADGEPVAGPAVIDLSGRAVFDGLALTIPTGRTRELTLVGGVPSAAPSGAEADLIAFDLKDPSADLDAVTAGGEELVVELKTPNLLSQADASSGYEFRRYVKVLAHGRLHVEWRARSADVLPGVEAEAGRLVFRSEDDAFRVTALAFAQPGGIATAFPDVRLGYGGEPAVGSPYLLVNDTQQLAFTGLAIDVPIDKTVEVPLYARATKGDYGQLFAVKFQPEALLQFESLVSGQKYSEADLGPATADDFYVDRGQSSGLRLRYAKLEATNKGPTSGTIGRANYQPTLKFALKAVSDTVKIRKLSFKLTPNDAGRAGELNDALEQWSALDGGLDANHVADLVLLSADGDETVIGEDITTNLRLRTYAGSSELQASQDRQIVATSPSGGYAYLEYVFPQGSEYYLPPNQEAVFELRLDTTTFWRSNVSGENAEFRLGVSLMGDQYFQWFDSANTSDEFVRTGADTGLPIAGYFNIAKP